MCPKIEKKMEVSEKYKAVSKICIDGTSKSQNIRKSTGMTDTWPVDDVPANIENFILEVQRDYKIGHLAQWFQPSCNQRLGLRE